MDQQDVTGSGSELTSSQGIFEGLLKAEELEAASGQSWFGRGCLNLDSHGQVDSGMEAQSALVRAKSRVELHAVAAVDLQTATVVFPHDAELKYALGDGANLEGGAVLGMLLKELACLESAGQLYKQSVSRFLFVL